MVKSLTKFQYRAFNHPEMHPMFHIFVDEREWYSDDAGSTLGVVFRDRVDDDWGYVVLSPDQKGEFRCVNVDSSIATIQEAREQVFEEVDRVSRRPGTGGFRGRGMPVTVQRGVDGRDPFKPLVAQEKLSRLFRLLAGYDAWSPARGMIREVYGSFADLDGNFLEQFQTTGFDSRIWELYLHAYLVDAGFSLLPSQRPDFVISKAGITLGIEAVTANRTQNGSRDPDVSYTWPLLIDPESYLNDSSFVDKEKNFVPIRLGSALFSKLQKRYWEVEQIAGRPLIFAIETFHDLHSLHYSSSALGTYLYGFRHECLWDPQGRLLVVPKKVDTHTYAGKTIQSGFFFLPHAENVSAVLFSNSGTVSKFNRMGQSGDHRNPRIRLICNGTCYNPDPDAATPLSFSYDVEDPRYAEWWGQGIEMFHNPMAVHPVDRRLFPGIAHHRLEGGNIYTEAPEFQPLASFTLNISVERDPRLIDALVKPLSGHATDGNHDGLPMADR